MKNLGDTVFARMLGWLADVVLRHPRWFIWPQLILAGVCILTAAIGLKFDTSRSNLVGGDKKYQRMFLEYRREFPACDDMVVIAESDDAEKNRQFVERLGAKLELDTNLFSSVFYKGDLKMLGRKALLFVPENELEQMQEMLRQYRPFITQFTETTNLISFFNAINTRFRTAKQEADSENKSLVGALPALERIVVQAEDCLQRSGTPPTPGVTALFGASAEAEQRIYLTLAQGRFYLVTAQARRVELEGEAVKRMRSLMEETKAEVPGINAGLTGSPVLEHDEMLQSQKDTAWATGLALVLCALIFIFGYKETGRPVKATLCLLVGLAYTLGFATVVVGHLNLLTITFLPMLVGLAIDFGVHLVTRYEEELRHGRTEAGALRKAMIYTGQGIFTGAFTTAGAFLAIVFTDFKGIQEMGLISGGGLLICLIPMLTMLPALLLRGHQNVIDHVIGERPQHRQRLEQVWLQRPAWALGVMVAISLICMWQFKKVYFDYDLLNMQSKGLPAVAYEQKLIKSTPKSVLFAAVVAENAKEAVTLKKKIEALPSVSEVESISQFLLGDQTRKLQLIGEIKDEVATLHFEEVDVRPVDVEKLSGTLYSLQGYLGAAAEAAGEEKAEIKRQLLSLREAITELRKQMLAMNADIAGVRLAGFQQSLFNDIQATFEAIRDQDNSGALRAEDLPQALRSRFVGVNGKHLLQVYPRKDVWQRPNQKEFVEELRRALDPQGTGRPLITGEPVQLLEYTSLLRTSYETAAWYSLGAIVLLVFIHFRKISLVLLALVPVVIGAIWLGGFMGLCNIPFNPANIMTLPLVIGIGVTNGIHILNRFAEEKTAGIFSKSTGKAVLVSGLTTIAGFGSLIIAEHRGIQSLGYVMAVGVATCMVAGLTFLPALLRLLVQKK